MSRAYDKFFDNSVEGRTYHKALDKLRNFVNKETEKAYQEKKAKEIRTDSDGTTRDSFVSSVMEKIHKEKDPIKETLKKLADLRVRLDSDINSYPERRDKEDKKRSTGKFSMRSLHKSEKIPGTLTDEEAQEQDNINTQLMLRPEEFRNSPQRIKPEETRKAS